MRNALKYLLAGIIGLQGIAFAQDREALYSAGKSAWEQKQWEAAYRSLREYRLLKYGKRPDIDYMLGTSACRLEGLQLWGGNTLHAMLYTYPLTLKSRRVVRSELEACRGQTARSENLLRVALIDWPPAGMNAVFKTFYWSNDVQPVASYPMRRVETFDRSHFTRRLVRLGDTEAASAMAAEMSPSGRAIVSNRLILISESGHDRQELETIAQSLDQYADFLGAEYGIGGLDHYVTIYLVPNSGEVQRRARQLHGLDVSGATLGYAYADDLSLVAFVPGSAAGTVLHELFHLLVRAEFGNIPQWLDEGLASLYEVSVNNGERYWGVDNWRGEVLRILWDNYRPSIEELIRSDWYLFDDPAQAAAIEAAEENPDELLYREDESARQAAMMAVARYFALYLQETEQLAAVFDAVRQNDISAIEDRQVDPADHAVRVVKTALEAQDLAEIDAAFADWFLNGAAKDAGRLLKDISVEGKSLPDQTYRATTAVNIRRGPGLEYSRIGGLVSGDIVEVVSIENGWAEILLRNDALGYVFAQYLRPAN